MGDKPVNFVSWLDAARYANWLHNGKPTGIQDPTTTEYGAYDLGGILPGSFAQRLPGANWFLPTQQQWELTAYYKPGPGASYGYPTQRDTAPIRATAATDGDVNNPGLNVANYDRGAVWNGKAGNVTSVGSAGRRSTSFWGTYDQGGNVAEWTETISSVRRVVLGGSFSDRSGALRNGSGVAKTYNTETATIGLRVGRTTSGIQPPQSDQR